MLALLVVGLDALRVGTGLTFSGSDFLILLHKKSGLGNFRVSGLDGLDQKSGPGFGLM